VTRDEALRKYNQEPRFHRFVTYLMQDVWSGAWTPEEILAAAELAGFLAEEKRKLIPKTIVNPSEGGRARYPGEIVSELKE
jgi:hypothetical protein